LKQPIPFGKYFLLERINVGGMAEVFKAKATGVEGFERLVAVKRILPSIAEDEEFITMFVDEAKIAVQLTHANIAQIFDLGRVEGSFFIALEYVHGKDLRAIFNRTRQRGELLPIPMSCYAVMKLCEGLDYAHNKRDASGDFLNLVHRDVSPQNILISYEGEVKIIDFGIAKAAGKAGRTQAGILKGKFGYMSPEQVLGLDIDRRSDVFGVGICLYELLTGERLFVAESDFATLEKVRSVDVMPPSTYNRRIPEELEQIVMRALARDRDQRYQTALQLHDELQAFMHTSGNLFSRKDLSGYMHRVFAEEIERETARDQEYAQLGTPNFVAEPSGLEVFDEIDPVSTVSALHAQPFAQAPSPSVAPAPVSRPRKSTLLGIPQVAGRPGGKVAPSVPRLVPRLQSIPPQGGVPARAAISTQRIDSSPPAAARIESMPPKPQSSPGMPGSQFTPPLDPRVPRAPANASMEWDDEELSTQIYDKPDDHSLAFMFGATVKSPESLPSAPPDALIAPAVLPQDVPPPAAAPPRRPAPMPAPMAPAFPASQHATVEIPPWEQKSKTSPAIVAVLVVVGIIALIVTGLVVFGKPDPGNVHFATVPSKVSVAVDGKPLASATSPFVIAQLPPNVEHTIAVSQQGYRPWTTKVELAPGQTLQLPTVTLERIETGFAVDSEPQGATVFVDGTRMGETPVRLTDLPPGEHKIRLEREGHAPWDSVLHTSTGTVLPLSTVSLQPLPTPPTSGRRSSSSSGTLSASEASSRHRARESASSDDGDTSQPVPTSTSRRSSAAAEPEPDPADESSDLAPPPAAAHEAPAHTAEEPAAAATGPGTLRVNSRPWAQVFVDGKLVGVTPQRGISLAPGSHTLMLVNDEFSIRKTVPIEIKSGEITTQVLNLAE
jgi:eukaryotic-like serine/threonine-protein kinase